MARGWTQEAVAERMGTSVRQLRDYELGKRPPSVAMLEQWLEALEAPAVELTRPSVPAKPKRGRPRKQLAATPTIELPFFGSLWVACGWLTDQPREIGDEVQSIDVDARGVQPKRDFVVRATGDSMEGGALPIHDGDLVLCRRVEAARPTDHEGRPVLIVGLDDPDTTIATLKSLVYSRAHWHLRPQNPNYKPEPIPWKDWRIAALVIKTLPRDPPPKPG